MCEEEVVWEKNRIRKLLIFYWMYLGRKIDQNLHENKGCMATKIAC